MKIKAPDRQDTLLLKLREEWNETGQSKVLSKL